MRIHVKLQSYPILVQYRADILAYVALEFCPIFFNHRITIICPKTALETDGHACISLPVILSVHFHVTAFFA